jgi:hypothetical protein
LAKHLGARVITTASAANLSYLRDLGADQVIDYNTTDFTKVVSNCDAVFDTVGGDVASAPSQFSSRAAAPPSLRPGEGADARSERRDGLRPHVGRDRPHLERIAALYQAGVIRKPEVTLYQIVRSRRSHAAERGASRQRQAGVQGEVTRAYSQIMHARCSC